MKESEEKVRDKKTERVLSTLFIAMFPALLLAIVSNVTTGIVRIMIQIVIIFFQFIIFKRIFDDYYKYLE